MRAMLELCFSQPTRWKRGGGANFELAGNPLLTTISYNHYIAAESPNRNDSKSFKTNKKQLRSIKISRNQLKSFKINSNQLKSLEINQNQSTWIEINQIHLLSGPGPIDFLHIFWNRVTALGMFYVCVSEPTWLKHYLGGLWQTLTLLNYLVCFIRFDGVGFYFELAETFWVTTIS